MEQVILLAILVKIFICSELSSGIYCRVKWLSTDVSSLMMEAVRTSETSVDNHFTRQYNPEYNSEHHTRRRENLKSHKIFIVFLSS
jgi:hypothetical protein